MHVVNNVCFIPKLTTFKTNTIQFDFIINLAKINCLIMWSVVVKITFPLNNSTSNFGAYLASDLCIRIMSVEFIRHVRDWTLMVCTE